MTPRDRRVGLLVLALSASLTLTGAPLRPLVQRNAQPNGPVPAECNESLAPSTTPRVNVAELQSAVQPVRATANDLVAPPSGTLRTELRAVQTALDRNDRPAFDEHLARAKTMLASYPTGGERRAAEEAVRIYDDATRVWDAQFESPFFDESSQAYARLRSYPGWSDAVRRGMLEDDRGRRFFPASESRRYLAGIAADRLGRLGVTASAPAPPRSVARPTPPETKPPAKVTKRRPNKVTTTERAPSKPAVRKTTPKPTPPEKKPAVAAKTTSAPKAVAAKPVEPKRAEPKPVATATVAPPPVVPAPAPTPAPVTETVATNTAPITDTTPFTDTALLTDTAFVTDTALSTDTALTSAAATDTTTTIDTAPVTTTTAAAATPTERTRSVIIPVILILVGLGVLIVLFKASN